MEWVDLDRIMPHKSLEEKMIKFRRECEAKFKEDLDNEISRLKNFELSKIRMEEA